MLEVELKVRVNHDRLRPALEAVGADPRDTVRQVDTYYDAPDRDFAVTDEALRIRRETTAEGSEQVQLTYKGPLVDSDSKTRAEAETRVADADATESILSGLGYEPAATIRKDRERYTVDGYVVTLDAVDDLGEFVEVEAAGPVDQGELAAARDGAAAILRDLGLDPDDQIRESYLALVLRRGSENDPE